MHLQRTGWVANVVSVHGAFCGGASSSAYNHRQPYKPIMAYSLPKVGTSKKDVKVVQGIPYGDLQPPQTPFGDRTPISFQGYLRGIHMDVPMDGCTLVPGSFRLT